MCRYIAAAADVYARGADPGDSGVLPPWKHVGVVRVCFHPRNVTFFHSKLMLDNSTSFASSRMKRLCQKWKVELIFQGAYRLPVSGVVFECLEIIDVGCNLKQFDGLTWLNLPTTPAYDRSTYATVLIERRYARTCRCDCPSVWFVALLYTCMGLGGISSETELRWSVQPEWRVTNTGRHAWHLEVMVMSTVTALHFAVYLCTTFNIFALQSSTANVCIELWRFVAWISVAAVLTSRDF